MAARRTAIGRQRDDDGNWSASAWIDQALKMRDDYHAIVRDWNQFVPQYNAVVVPRQRNVGRPLLASDAQVDEVLKLRKAGKSLRTIAEETSLGLRTVCTIVDKGAGTD